MEHAEKKISSSSALKLSPCQELASPQFSQPQTPPRPSGESTWSPHHRPTLFHHCVASLRRHKGGTINSVAILRSGLVITSSNSSRIHVWRKLDYVDIGYIKASSAEVRGMIAYGDMLFTSHKDHKIRVSKVSGGHIGRKFSPKKIISLPKSSYNFLFFTKTNVHQQHKDTISCMAYCHAEGTLYTGSWDWTIKAWKVSDQKCIDTFVAHADKINALVINQDDGCLFSGSSDGTVKIWRRGYGGCSHNLTMTLKFQYSPVNALALSVSPSGSYLYSGSSNGYTNFWVKEKLSCRYNHGGFLEGHKLAVLCLTAIGKLVISGSEDTTIRVWTREDGSVYHECLLILEGHKGPVKCLNACLESEDTRGFKALFVYSGSFDQTFKVWRVQFSHEVNDAYVDSTSHVLDDEDDVGSLKYIEYEMSPVLSPLWVDKKRQVSTY